MFATKFGKKKIETSVPGMTRQNVKQNLLFYVSGAYVSALYPRHIEQSHSFNNMKYHISTDILKK